MPEVAGAGEDHGQAGRVGGRDDLVVAHRAAGLDDRGRPRLGRGQQAVGEREEGVGGDRRAPRQGFGQARRRGRVLGLAATARPSNRRNTASP